MNFLNLAANNEVEEIKLLLAQGSRPDFSLRDEFGMSLLEIVAESGLVELWQALSPWIPKDALKQRDSNQCTLLHFACLSNKIEMVELILKAAPELLTAVDESGALPIHWTSEHGYHTLLPLVTRPEILNTQDKNGWSALHYAAANNRIETVKWLLTQNADTSLTDHSNRTPLQLADEKQFEDIVEILSKHSFSRQ